MAEPLLQSDCISESDTTDFNNRDREALFDAVHRDELDKATLLASVLTDSSMLDRPNRRSKTLLYLAIQNENVPMVRMLIENGASVNVSSYCDTYCTTEVPLVTATRHQNRELVEFILEQDCDFEGSPSFPDGKTALQWAASFGDISLAEVLLGHGADINWIGLYHQTALHYASVVDHADMVSWLLENGAEININGDGRSPLHIASVRGNLNIVNHLLAFGCSRDGKDKYGYAPLSLASLRGHLDIMKSLLANSSNGTEFDLGDALGRAAESGHLHVVEFLIKCGADVNSPNGVGETSLALAARGSYSVVLTLLLHEANMNIMDTRGLTALQLSLMRNQTDISLLLIIHGAALNSGGQGTDTPLTLAYNHSNALVIKCMIQAGCCLQLEPWFTVAVIQQRLHELHQSVNPSVHQSERTEGLMFLWRWIAYSLNQPWSLRNLCRLAARRHLMNINGGCSILKSVSRLPLPNALVKYLSMKEVKFEF